MSEAFGSLRDAHRTQTAPQIVNRLTTIREKLDRLKSLEVRSKVHGAGGHGYREMPVLDEASIVRLEVDWYEDWLDRSLARTS
jgi:hypothetical protein